MYPPMITGAGNWGNEMNGLTFGQAVALEVVRTVLENPSMRKDGDDLADNAVKIASYIDAQYPFAYVEEHQLEAKARREEQEE